MVYAYIHCVQKPTYTDRYLHFKSHHPNHVNRGVVRCLYQRMELFEEALNSAQVKPVLWKRYTHR